MARPRMRPNLFELPDPLLDELLVHVDDESLVELGATCRKCNNKALNTFFDRHGILIDGMLHIYDQPPMSLKAVRGAMFVRDLREIHYYFHPNGEKLLADVHDMTRLVERLTHVSGQVGFHFSLFDRWEPYDGGRSHTVDPVAWKRVMSTLLDKVLDKGCQELCVTGGVDFATLFPGNPVLRAKDPRRTLTPTVSLMPVVPQLCNDLPIAVDSIAANLINNTSIRDSKPPLPTQEVITAKPRGLFSFFQKRSRKTPASVQLTTRFERLDGAGDTPQLVVSPPIQSTTVPGSALTPQTPSTGNLDGAGDDPIPIRPITRLEQALTPPVLSSPQQSKQQDTEGSKGDIYHTRKMTLFRVHSVMLLEDPFLDWTVSAIMASASTLTTLSIMCTSIHTDVWHIVLRSIYLPHLRDFALRDGSSSATRPLGANHLDLHYFLERHPTIKILSLYSPSQVGSPFNPLKAPILPNLVDLKAHPYYITWILSCIKLYPTSMPDLTSITIGSVYLNADPFRPADFDNAIRSVSDIQRKVELCIYFASLSQSDIHPWLQSHVDMHATPSPIASLHHIQELAISLFFFTDLPVAVLYVLPAWLNLFPSLRSLKFYELPPEVVRWIDALDFKQILADGCPKMEKMFDSRGAQVNLCELRGRSRAMEDGSGDSGPGWGMGDPTADGSG